MDAMNVRCDEDSMQERRNRERDVRVSQAADRGELPDGESLRHSDDHERCPHEQATYTQFVLWHRLDRALRMLRDPRQAARRISDIAYDVGRGQGLESPGLPCLRRP